MTRVLQTLIGFLFALLGIGVIAGAVAVMVLAKAVTMWGVILVAIGAAILFWGGVIVPNSGVEDGAKKLTVFVGPFLPYLPGGRRATDGAAPPASPAASPDLTLPPPSSRDHT